MSATLGGASFSLDADLTRFRQNLQRARAEAQAAAEDIARALAGAGGTGGGPGVAAGIDRNLVALEAAADRAVAAVDRLTVALEASAGASAAQRAGLNGSAQAYQQVAAAATQATQAQNGAAQQAQTVAAAQGQVRQATQSATSAVAAQGAGFLEAVRRAEEYRKALNAAQAATNTLNAATARRQQADQGLGAFSGAGLAELGIGDAPGQAEFERAVLATRAALDALATGDTAAALRVTRGALGEVNEALALFTARAAGADAAQEALEAALRDGTAASLQQVVALQREADALREDVAAAQALLSARRQLQIVERNLTAPERIAEETAQREANAVARRTQAEAERELAAAERNRRINLQNAGYLAGDLGRTLGLPGAGGALGVGLRGAGFASQFELAASTAATVALSTAVLALGAGLIETGRAGLQFNSFLETSEVRLEAATGSAEKAREAISELVAASTGRVFGFAQTEELAKVDELLRRIGKDGEENLRRVADASAATGRDFSDTGTQIAALYDSIENQQPFGDMARSLARAGILTEAWAQQLIAAAEDGRPVEEQVALLDAALDRFNGTAERMTATGTGSLQRLKNELRAIAGAGTEDAFSGMSRAIREVSDALGNPAIREGVQRLTTLAAALLFPGPVVGTRLGFGIRDRIFGPPETPAVGRLAGTGADPQKILTERLESGQAALEAGRQAVASFARGFDEEAGAQFDRIAETVERHLAAISGGDLSSQLEVQFRGTLLPIIAEIAFQIQHYGTVSEDTTRKVVQHFGEQADEVLELATAFGDLERTQRAAAEAARLVADQQGRIEIHSELAEAQLRVDQQAIDAAREVQRAHRAAAEESVALIETQIRGYQRLKDNLDTLYDQQLRDQRKVLDDLQDAERANARAAQDAIRGMQDDLEDYRRGIDDRRRAADAEIDAVRDRIKDLNDEMRGLQEAQAEHQAAFNAVINGTLDLFNQEHAEVDDITRAIIEKWDAEIRGARLARQEAEQRVDQFDLRDAETRVSFERRIAAARQAGREAEARALERERDRVLARSRQESQLARAEAELAAIRERDRVEDARKAAEQRNSADQVAINNAEARAEAAQAELEVLQEIEEAKREAEEEEIRRREDAIDAAQRAEEVRARNAQKAIEDQQEKIALIEEEKRKVDEYYDDLIRQSQRRLEDIREEAREQDRADQARIDQAQKFYDADKAYWESRLRQDRALLERLEDQKEELDKQVEVYQTQIDRLDDINKRLDDQILKQQQLLAIMRELAGVGNAGSRPSTVPGAGGGATPGGGGGGAGPTSPGSEGPGGSPGSGDTTGLGGGPGWQGPEGRAWPAGTLLNAVNAVTGGDKRARLAMLMGAWLEGAQGRLDGPYGVGDGGYSFGPWQINASAHRGWTRAAAENPNIAAPAMYGTGVTRGYANAVEAIGLAQWESNPMQAAADAAFLAEAPAHMYPAGRVQDAWQNTRALAGYAEGGTIREHIVGVGQRTGTVYEFGERAGRGSFEYVVPDHKLPPGLGGGVSGPLFSIGQLNASSTADVDRFFDRAKEEVAGLLLGSWDVASRGGVVPGLSRRR